MEIENEYADALCHLVNLQPKMPVVAREDDHILECISSCVEDVVDSYLTSDERFSKQ